MTQHRVEEIVKDHEEDGTPEKVTNPQAKYRLSKG